MKKAFLFPLLMASIGLSSCGNNPVDSSLPSSSINMEEVNKLKELLAKQDLSPVYDKMFFSQFTQDYETYSSNNGEDEEEAETQFYTYHGKGMFGCLYEVSEDAYNEVEALENPDFFDYLAHGKGSYEMIQQGSLVSYLHQDEGANATSSLQHMEFVQQVEACFSEASVQVVNSLGTKPTIGEGGYNADEMQRFNGIIDKEILFDTISVRALSDIFASTNLFDGQRSCEALDRIYFATVKQLCSKSDAELYEFIERNAIHIEEEEEDIVVHFAIGDEQLRDTLDEHDIIPGVFEGTLTYEKDSGKFDAYDYQIIYTNDHADEDSGNVHNVSMEFKATGYSWNQKYDRELYIDPNPAVYEDAETFLEDVVREVVPPLF